MVKYPQATCGILNELIKHDVNTIHAFSCEDFISKLISKKAVQGLRI